MSTVEEFESRKGDHSTANKRRRVLVIGMDAVTLDLLYPWIDEGKLPNIARLMKDGVHGKLASTIQPITAPAWTSFMTGMNPGKHGLYDFVRRQENGYDIEVTNGSMITVPTMFERISQAGKRVVAINVPYTYPPKPLNGIVVSGPFIAVNDASIIHPPEKAEEILGLVNNYKVLPDYDATKDQPLTAYGNALLEGIEMRRRVALHLIEEDWDLFTVVFMETDPVQHHFWHCMSEPGEMEDCPGDMILKVYQQVDKAIADLLTVVDENTFIILLLDHGAGRLYKILNLNRWLAQHDWLTFKSNKGKEKHQLQSTLVNRIMRLYRRHFNSNVRLRIKTWLGSNRFDKLKGNVESTLFTSAIDWTKTRAYALGAGGNIFINLEGREPEGIVKPGEEYNELVELITSEFMNLVDPETGEKLIRKVWRRNELYSGPYVDKAPDLILEWIHFGYWGRGRYDVQNAPLFEDLQTLDFTDLVLSGTHRRHGVVFLKGPAIKKGYLMQDAEIIDLAPTILALLDIPIPEDMDGNVLMDAWSSGHFDVKYGGKSFSEGDSKEFTDDET